MADDLWPALPYDEWKDTYATLHMWSQIVGKIALAQAAPVNHSWAIALDVTARGLTTKTLPHGQRSFRIAFDFVDHLLVIETSDGDRRTFPLSPRSVADFYRELMATLRDMALPVTIWPMPVELLSPIRFDEDVVHRSYDAVYVQRFFTILVRVQQVMTAARCRFVGKCSPAHFFWGAFDLALTRFSGRLAPPREGPAFMREAYTHEVISHGFWPGSGIVTEPAFYAYAVPTPSGFESMAVQPPGAFYHGEFGEFILPYNVMRSSSDPDRALHTFITSTYEQAATLAGWDRSALER